MRRESTTIRFLYRTTLGRGILKVLVQPCISKLVGSILTTSCSRWIVPIFVKKHNIDMDEYKNRKFVSFNDFFTRKRETNKIDKSSRHLISPCDGYLSVYPVSEQQTYYIKNTEYNLERLLQNSELAKKYAGGLCLIFRLTPQNYHRYCYVCNGIKNKSYQIAGKLHCVRPIAYLSVPVFVENSREYTVIQSEHLGQVIQMEIGALLVGKIYNYESAKEVFKGQEKGYFEFGGSTILVLIEKDKVNVFDKIIRDTQEGKETPVYLGEAVGTVV